MAVLSINDFLPTGDKIRKIHTGSELLLAYELDKYSKLYLDSSVSLADISIAKEIQASDYFSFVASSGLDLGFQPATETLSDLTKSIKYFFRETVEGLALKSISDDSVVYDHDFDINANRILYRDNRASGYVSLMAYLMVKAKLEGKPTPRLVIDHERYNQHELEYSDLLILRDYGNRILRNLVDIRHNSSWGLQPEWEAFVMFHRQRGDMDREYTTKDKFKYMRKNFEVGDVVLLYQRSKPTHGRTINQLKSCYPAVIKEFTPTGVKLAHYPIIQTKLTRYTELDSLEQDMESDGKESIYTHDDYARFMESVETYSYTEIGVDLCTWNEPFFFIKPIDSDGSYQYFSTPEGSDKVFLSTFDTIYAVFEDRGVSYNREKFLQTYFPHRGRLPVYDQYKARLEASK